MTINGDYLHWALCLYKSVRACVRACVHGNMSEKVFKTGGKKEARANWIIGLDVVSRHESNCNLIRWRDIM
jgi:hypothetical protein